MAQVQRRRIGKCVCVREREGGRDRRERRHLLVNDVFHLLTSDAAVSRVHYAAAEVGHTRQTSVNKGGRESWGHTHPPLSIFVRTSTDIIHDTAAYPNHHNHCHPKYLVLILNQSSVGSIYLSAHILPGFRIILLTWGVRFQKGLSQMWSMASWTNIAVVPLKEPLEPRLAPAELLGGRRRQSSGRLRE